MKPIHVGTSPITGRIFAGTVLKDNLTWGAGKIDVTGNACAAVAQHAIYMGVPIVVSANGIPVYEITVRQLTDEKS